MPLLVTLYSTSTLFSINLQAGNFCNRRAESGCNLTVVKPDYILHGIFLLAVAS